MERTASSNQLCFNQTESIERRFSNFVELIDQYGLNSFVAFLAHKNFTITNLNELNDEQKAVLIDESRPLLLEAVEQQQSVQ